MARLSLSVAPEVKMISLEVAPISLAICSRAVSTAFFGLPAKRVVAAGGVAELLREVGQHRFQHPGIHGRGGVVVHVDRQLHAVGGSALLLGFGVSICPLGDGLYIGAHNCSPQNLLNQWLRIRLQLLALSCRTLSWPALPPSCADSSFISRDSDAPQQLFDSVAHPPQRFADIAAVALVTFAAHGNA